MLQKEMDKRVGDKKQTKTKNIENEEEIVTLQKQVNDLTEHKQVMQARYDGLLEETNQLNHGK